MKVLDVALLRADLKGFGLCSFEVFLLTNGGHEADDIVAFLYKPGKNTGGIKTAAVGETDSLFFRHIGGVRGAINLGCSGRQLW